MPALLAAFVATIFGFSTVLGFIIGLFRKYELCNKFLSILHINAKHIIPTAWDYFFSTSKPCYVIVELFDGIKFTGFMKLNRIVQKQKMGKIFTYKRYTMLMRKGIGQVFLQT